MSSLYCLFSDFECRLWPSNAISVKVMQGKVPLFFIGQAMFKMAFLCQTSRFRDLLASGPLLASSYEWLGLLYSRATQLEIDF